MRAEKVSHGWNRGFWEVVARDAALIWRTREPDWNMKRPKQRSGELHKATVLSQGQWLSSSMWFHLSFVSSCPQVKWLKDFIFFLKKKKKTAHVVAGSVDQIISSTSDLVPVSVLQQVSAELGGTGSAARSSYRTKLDSVSTARVEAVSKRWHRPETCRQKGSELVAACERPVC